MSEELIIEQNKIIIKRKDFNYLFMIIAILGILLSLTFLIISVNHNETYLFIKLAIISVVISILFGILGVVKAKIFEYITFDKDYFIVKSGIKRKIPSTRIIEFEAVSGYSKDKPTCFITVYYLDENNKNKKSTHTVMIDNKKFVKTANSRVKQYKKDANVELVEDKINDIHYQLAHRKEIEVMFLGKIKYGKGVFRKSSELAFVTSDYVPIFFDMHKCYNLDLKNMEQYKKYTVRAAANYADEYVFDEIIEKKKKVDIIRINEVKKEIEKDGDEIIYDIKIVEDEIEFQKKKNKLTKASLIFIFSYFFIAMLLLRLAENEEEIKWVSIVLLSIFIIAIIVYMILKFKLKIDYKKIYKEK